MKICALAVMVLTSVVFLTGDLVQAKPAQNPIIWADVPDVTAIRVGETYYMASTTMHMSPGLPIMKSKNLVNWELIGYAYDTLADNAALRLDNGRNAYGAGHWAPSLRYHEGTYYVSTFSSTSGRTHIFTTTDIESGKWNEISFSPSLHDHSLFFDDDGRVYMVYGGGRLTLVELKSDLSGIKEGGVNQVIVENVNVLFGENEVGGLNGEGSQLTKVNGKYYLLNIASPRSRWSRSVLIHRADTITGPYEGRVALEDKGVAQGCLIDTPDGKWYALLFQDNGSVGRSPWLVPVTWEDGWPVLGVDGKAPVTLDIEDTRTLLDSNIVASDEFDRKPGDALPLAWQWNHNPDNSKWSIGQRQGHLRITTGRIDNSVLSARNTLTQRTFGPVSSATTKIDVTNMKDGDYAGLIALQQRFGAVGVKMEDDAKSIVMMGVASQQSQRRGPGDRTSQPVEIESVPLTQSLVYFRIDCDFRSRTDKANFYYSLDGMTWTKIGSTLQMAYTMPHFMGYRFGLFNYATKTAGGFVDFDYYRIGDTLAGEEKATQPEAVRQRILLNTGWRFQKGDPDGDSTGLIYDERPEVGPQREVVPADAMPTEAVKVETTQAVLKPWILPTGNAFVKDPAGRHARPDGNPGGDCPYVRDDFDDRSWQRVDLPHDWAIKGPFQQGWDSAVGGGMGRLPSPGIGWYRRALDIPASDAGKSIFLDVDGAMSYAMVWLNGQLVGGWPYGYASWRVDLTPYIRAGENNQLAIRIDNPPESSRWYPGGGIYRNVWLTTTHPVHIAQWGTFITTRDVSADSAVIDLEVVVDNDSAQKADVKVTTSIFTLSAEGNITGDAVVDFEPSNTSIAAGQSGTVKSSVTLQNPRLWGPPPNQTPHRYAAMTTVRHEGHIIDQYETRFGIRSLRFDPNTGVHVNGERIFIKGVNQHHDLGALGAAFNVRAAERQLEILREMGCNAIRTAHNPPAPELLELTDRMGFLVVNEIFDAWARRKAPLDFHLIFPDWHEQDTRAWVRRDRNHPSVIMWSFGNEVGEQYTGHEGAAIARRLHEIIRQEDVTRPTTAAMNYAKPDMPMPGTMDVISLNYQGEGIRNSGAYAGLRGINTPPLYSAFHDAHPDKVILSSENAAALSTRGTYLFPVFDGHSAPVRDGIGGDPTVQHVSAYELHTADFGSSADKVFAAQDQHPFVAGGFVWSGWDYLGEPTPYYNARSSYFGIIDLAGFKKDRFYLYQSHWRPNLPMAHILPHWTWPERVGQVTPVHVFTSGDEAELFLNGTSLGRKAKGEYEYRLRWDDVVYEPGQLKVVAYKDGQRWAEDVKVTTGAPAGMELTADRAVIHADGKDLAFVTVRIMDKDGLTAPRADNLMAFTIEGPGQIVATDNGDPTDFMAFASHQRKAFNGFCLVIIRAVPDQPGIITLKARSESLETATLQIQTTTKSTSLVNQTAEHANSDPDPNFYVFLCFGQSNMDGAGKIEKQDLEVDERFQVLAALDMPRLNRTKGQWYPAIPPLCRGTGGLGPADYFGRTLVANLPEHIRVGVINVAIPGCKIELFEKDTFESYAATAPDWMTNFINEYGGNPYRHLVNMARVAQKSGVIKGILLHQGESNANDQQWPNKVKGVYDNLIRDLSLNPDEVPLLAGQTVHADQRGVCAAMNTIIAKLPGTLANSYVISSAGCTCQPDRLHFDSAGNRELGKRYAATMLTLLGHE